MVYLVLLLYTHSSVQSDSKNGFAYMQINITNKNNQLSNENGNIQNCHTKSYQKVIPEKISLYLTNFATIVDFLLIDKFFETDVEYTTLVKIIKKIIQNLTPGSITNCSTDEVYLILENALKSFFYHSHKLFLDVELFFFHKNRVESVRTDIYAKLLGFLHKFSNNQNLINRLNVFVNEYANINQQFVCLGPGISNNNQSLLSIQYKNLLTSFFNFFLDETLNATEIYQQISSIKKQNNILDLYTNHFKPPQTSLYDFNLLWKKKDEFTCVRCCNIDNIRSLESIEKALQNVLDFMSSFANDGLRTLICFDFNFYTSVLDAVDTYIQTPTHTIELQDFFSSCKIFIFDKLFVGEKTVIACLVILNSLNDVLEQCRVHEEKDKKNTKSVINEIGLLYINQKVDVLSLCKKRYDDFSEDMKAKFINIKTLYNLVNEVTKKFVDAIKNVLKILDSNLCVLLEVESNEICDATEEIVEEIKMRAFYNTVKTYKPRQKFTIDDIKTKSNSIFASTFESLHKKFSLFDNNNKECIKKKPTQKKVNSNCITYISENQKSLDDETLFEIFNKASESEKKKVKSKTKPAKKKTKIKANENTNENTNEINNNKIAESDIKEAENSIILNDEPLKTKSINKKIGNTPIIIDAAPFVNQNTNSNDTNVPISLDSDICKIQLTKSQSTKKPVEKSDNRCVTLTNQKDLHSNDKLKQINKDIEPNQAKIKSIKKTEHRSRTDKHKKTRVHKQKKISQDSINKNVEKKIKLTDNDELNEPITSEERFEEYGKRKLIFYIRKLPSSSYMFDNYKDIDVENYIGKKPTNNNKKHTNDDLTNHTKDNYKCFDIQQTQRIEQDNLNISNSNQKIKHNIDDEDNEKNCLSNVDNIDKKLNLEQKYTIMKQNTTNKNIQRERQTISTIQNNNLDYQNTYKSDVKPYIKRLDEIKAIDKLSLNEKSDKSNRLNGSFNASKINDKRANTVNNINHYQDENQKQNTNHANINSYQDIQPDETLDNDEQICKIGMTEEQLYKYQVFEYYRENMVYYIYIQINNNAPNIGLSLRITNTEIIPLVPVTIVSQDKINDNMGNLNVSQSDMNQNELTNNLRHYTLPLGHSDILNNPDGYYIQEHDIFVGNRIHMKSVPCILKETYVQYHSTKQVVYKR